MKKYIKPAIEEIAIYTKYQLMDPSDVYNIPTENPQLAPGHKDNIPEEEKDDYTGIEW